MDRRTFLHTSTAAAATGALVPSVLRGGVPAPRELDRANPTAVRRSLYRYDGRVARVLSRMTLEEKVGQMIQAESGGLKDPDDVSRYALGSLLSGGNDDPKSGNGLTDWTGRYDDFQKRALTTRLRIPILYGIDAVHGHNNVLGAVIFPHNIGLGCTRNPALVEQAARITALETRATGIHWVFAPCIAVPRDVRWGRTYEGFGESPELARHLGAAAVRGLQGVDLNHPTSVLACAKHFAGDGGTTFGTGAPKDQPTAGRWPLDRGDTRLSEPELRRLHMQGYVTAINYGVGTIMPSYNSWNGVKCSANRRLLIEILKREMDFEGFLISDYNAIDELPGDYKQQIEASVLAGMDMFMVPSRYQEFHTSLLALVRDGRVPERRINGAVTRILRVKFALGLMNADRSPLADRRLHASFGSAAHRSVARACVRESVVVLKNANKTLPVSKTMPRVHVAGRSADDLGNQCGGWTIDWQGKRGDVTTGGTTVLAAIRQSVSSSTQVTYTKDGSGGEGATAGVVVIGETPYAEMFGDRDDLALADEDIAAVQAMSKLGIPLVVVLISGRPLFLEPILDSSAAVVAAWLPGTEGRGITDILFGDHKPTGKLSHTWPRAAAHLPLNDGERPAEALFPYGFGLSY